MMEFDNFNLVATMLRIMTRLNAILMYENLKSLAVTEKKVKNTMVLPFKNNFYSAITSRILKIFPLSLPTMTSLRLP